jgi:hypothetical protein
VATDLDERLPRRRVLAGAVVAVVGAMTTRLAIADDADAANGDAITVGGTFIGLDGTSVEATAPTATAFHGHNNDGTGLSGTTGGGSGAGVKGHANNTAVGVWGASTNGYGVYGESNNGTGVFGNTVITTAVHGQSTSGDASDFQSASNATGVLGRAGNIGTPGDPDSIALNTDETGVYGYSNTSGDSNGVWGDSWIGNGVYGTGDYGVLGVGSTVGLKGATFGDPAAYALYTTGRIKFAGRSGHTTIAKGSSYKDVGIPGMTSGADVFATIRTHKSGFYVASVVPYTNKFRIWLNKTATGSISVAYLVVG